MLLTSNTNAQMALEHEYQFTNEYGIILGASDLDYPLTVVNLLLSGRKYALQSFPITSPAQVLLYNLDYTLWKTINIPAIPNYNPTTAYYISENLFKIDGLVDMAIHYTPSSSTPARESKQVIIDETGAIIFTVDSSWVLQVMATGTDTFKAISNNTFYAGTNSGSRGGLQRCSVYSLPGTIPCSLCGGIGLGFKVPNGNTTGDLAAPIPNPSTNQVKISYSLPLGVKKGTITIYNSNGQLVKTLTVDNTFQYITLDNSELQSGNYFYNLSANGMQTTAKEMIIIK